MIIISPYARMLRNGEKNHPKNYPFWNELIPMIKEIDDTIFQVGSGNEEPLPGVTDMCLNFSLPNLAETVKQCKTWISVDSFFQHFCWDLGKKGIVLWGQSDPVIFGHPENINLLKSQSYLREKQFWMWEQTPYDSKAFVNPETVMNALHTLYS